MYIQFKTIAHRDKTMWATLSCIIIVSVLSFLLMPPSQNKLISMIGCIAIIMAAIVLVFFTKTNGITFFDEKFKKKVEYRSWIRPLILGIFAVVLFFLAEFLF